MVFCVVCDDRLFSRHHKLIYGVSYVLTLHAVNKSLFLVTLIRI